MKKTICTLIAVLLLAAVLTSGALAAENVEAPDMRLTVTLGEVSVTDESGEKVDRTDRMRLPDGWTVKTEENSYAWLMLDASKIFTMDENSSIRVEKDGSAFRITVLEGSLFFNVKEKTESDGTLEIGSAALAAQILNASGEIRVAEDLQTTFSLFDGMADISAVNKDGTKTGELLRLNPGEAICAEVTDPQTAEAQLGTVRPVAADQLSHLTVFCVLTDAGLKDRVDPKLYQEMETAAEEMTRSSVNNGAGAHIHLYPAEMIRTYTWAPDYQTCTGSVKCSVCGELLTEEAPAECASEIAAGCTEEGRKNYVAYFSHPAFTTAAGTENIEALGHDWKAPLFIWTEDYQTCTVTQTCARDPQHEQSQQAVTGDAVTTQPVCETEGVRTHTAAVTLGGYSYTGFVTESIPALGHSWGEPEYQWFGIDGAGVFSLSAAIPGCTAQCACENAGCDVILAETVTVREDDILVIQASTCTKPGQAQYTVRFTAPNFESRTIFSDQVPMAPHDLIFHPGTAPTCTESGEAQYWICAVCGQRFSDSLGEQTITDSVILAPAGHTLTEHAEIPATCTEPGQARYWTCTVCGQLFSDALGEQTITEPVILVPVGHSLTEHAETPATCIEPGTAAYWACSECGKLFSDENGEDAIEAPARISGSHVIPDVHYSCANGVYKAEGECEICHAYIEEESQDFTVESVFDDPCITGSLRIVVTGVFETPCFLSGTNTIVEDREPLGTHIWREPGFEWAEDCSYAIVRTTCINGSPDHELTESVTAVLDSGASYPATCEQDGCETYRVEITLVVGYDETAEEEDRLITQTFTSTQTKILPAAGHRYGESVTVWNEDHSQSTTRTECAVCGSVKETVS